MQATYEEAEGEPGVAIPATESNATEAIFEAEPRKEKENEIKQQKDKEAEISNPETQIKLKPLYRIKLMSESTKTEAFMRISTNDWNAAFNKMIDFMIEKFKNENIKLQSHNLLLFINDHTSIQIIDHISLKQAITQAVQNNVQQITIQIQVLFLFVCVCVCVLFFVWFFFRLLFVVFYYNSLFFFNPNTITDPKCHPKKKKKKKKTKQKKRKKKNKKKK